jgi:hypothetical protein
VNPFFIAYTSFSMLDNAILLNPLPCYLGWLLVSPPYIAATRFYQTNPLQQPFVTCSCVHPSTGLLRCPPSDSFHPAIASVGFMAVRRAGCEHLASVPAMMADFEATFIPARTTALLLL